MKTADSWCETCPVHGRGQCPETSEFIKDCKEFSEMMKARLLGEQNETTLL